MKHVAVVHAKHRLTRAKEAVETGRQAKTYEPILRAWTDFLHAANGVFTKLEQGAKDNGKSRAWFGRIKHLRKTDELLAYIKQARHADEHGIEPIMLYEAPKIALVSADYVSPPEKKGKERVFQIKNGPRFTSTIPKTLKLQDVRDERYGDVFKLPRSHMNQPLKGGNIWDLADLAIATIERLVAEAEALVTDAPVVRSASRGKDTQ